jgi:glycosyltransferase involved in cell wall biosynthesis
MTAGFSVVCLSSQDWLVELPTNRQQIMSRAAASGHRVLFVETGEFLGKHLWRLLRRGRRRSLASRLLSTEQTGRDIQTVKALNVLPWGHKYALANAVNRSVTAWRLRRLARRLPQPAVLWVYDPCAALAADRYGLAFSVYDCVDDYAEQVNGDRHRRALVQGSDARVGEAARLVFTTSQPLFERHHGWNRRTHLVPNVGDYGLFAPAVEREIAAPEVSALPRPVLGFAGNFVASKVDFELLEALARERPAATVLLIGPEWPESADALARLRALANVVWVGAKPHEELPRYVAAFDVALIPYVENAYTRSCFPLKVYESLAAGKPVVAAGLPELAGMGPDVVLARSTEEFIAAVDRAVAASGGDAVQRRRQVASRNTWETRTEQLLRLVQAELEA